MVILEAENLSCEKQDRLLFVDLNLQVSSTQLVIIRGENGAGKTSLMRILVGLSEAISGQVHIGGHCVRKALGYASEYLVYVGHKLGFNDLLSANENLSYWCALHQKQVSAASIQSVLNELGLTGFEDVPLRQLSAGQQRKVALARTWLQKSAKLWVLDEPFTSLDVDTVSQLEAHIASFLDNGGAVIMTSHQYTKLEEKADMFELEYDL